MFQGNKIYQIDKNGNTKRLFFVKGLSISFKGKNSKVIIHGKIPKFTRCAVKLGNNCSFEIGSSKYGIKKLRVYAIGENNNCKIGKNFSATSGCEIHLSPENGLKVTIGDDCMLGREVLIRATDGHAILDKSSGNAINVGKDVKIGNAVWLAQEVSVLKGVTISDGCVVGLKSIVTKSCTEPNSLYVGAPAKLVKTNIAWTREALAVE